MIKMILRFLVGSVAFHVLYYTLKTIVVPAFFSDKTPKAVVAEVAKRLVIYKFDIRALVNKCACSVVVGPCPRVHINVYHT